MLLNIYAKNMPRCNSLIDIFLPQLLSKKYTFFIPVDSNCPLNNSFGTFFAVEIKDIFKERRRRSYEKNT